MAITVPDYDTAMAFYHRTLGLPVRESWDNPEGRGAVLEAGVATIEILSADQADFIDQVEVGERVSGPIRLALEVADSAATAEQLAGSGGTLVAAAVVTPWGDRNARVRAPEGTQLTLFTAPVAG